MNSRFVNKEELQRFVRRHADNEDASDIVTNPTWKDAAAAADK